MMHQERYERALVAMVPDYAMREDDDTRLQRRQLMTARDIAAETLCHPADHVVPAVTLARVIHEVAGSYVFGGPADLGRAVAICRRLMVCANALDRLGGADG